MPKLRTVIHQICAGADYKKIIRQKFHISYLVNRISYMVSAPVAFASKVELTVSTKFSPKPQAI